MAERTGHATVRLHAFRGVPADAKEAIGTCYQRYQRSQRTDLGAPLSKDDELKNQDNGKGQKRYSELAKGEEVKHQKECGKDKADWTYKAEHRKA